MTSYCVFFHENLRGSSIWTKREDKCKCKNDEQVYAFNLNYFGDISVNPPSEKNYAVYFAYSLDQCNIDLMFLREYNSLKYAKKLCLEVYSRVNGCSPFTATGFGSFNFGPDGNFGPAVPITQKKTIKKISNDIIEEHLTPAFCYVVNKKTKIKHLLAISPNS